MYKQNNCGFIKTVKKHFFHYDVINTAVAFVVSKTTVKAYIIMNRKHYCLIDFFLNLNNDW